MSTPRTTQPLALGLIAAGVGLLLLRWLNWDLSDMAWPFTVIVPGLALLAVAALGQARLAPLAVPGAVVAGTGGILFALNLTNRWEAWAYMWALYPVFVGLALRLMARRQGTPALAVRGQRLVWLGALLLAAFGTLFEVFIFGGGFRLLGGGTLAVVLVMAGVALLLLGRARPTGTGKAL